MKKIILLITWLVLGFSFLWISNADVVKNMDNLVWTETKDVLMKSVEWDNPIKKIENWWLNMVKTVKIILSILIFAYLIYAGSMLMISMWAEDKMKAWKKHFYFMATALFFINIPWTIYNAFNVSEKTWKITPIWSSDFTSIWENSTNFFFNSKVWNITVEEWIMKSLEYVIILLSVAMFTIAWLQLMTSRWNKDKQTAGKNKLTFWVIWLAFLWWIKVWREVAYKASIDVAQTKLFSQIVNIAIYFSWPVALFFICWWWYYYITSAWDEAKAKKWKVILTNTFIAIFILIASYAVLNDFKNLIF